MSADHQHGAVPQVPTGIPLNYRLHGKGRVPGQEEARFDLDAFTEAMERRDIDYQVANYASDADIRIVGPDNPPSAPRIVNGSEAIRDWLRASTAHTLDLLVTNLVDGGNRVAFTEQSRHEDGTDLVASSTADVAEGLINIQRTILARGTSGEEPALPRAGGEAATQRRSPRAEAEHGLLHDAFLHWQQVMATDREAASKETGLVGDGSGAMFAEAVEEADHRQRDRDTD
jgi:hypothetical protein